MEHTGDAARVSKVLDQESGLFFRGLDATSAPFPGAGAGGARSDLDDLRGAPELETLRASPRFAALLERLEHRSR